ncbi:Uncharacterised protein [Mycobacteroides abscessus subsp. abscessus]|nr:Uncharacterised protein [Mycobacteroides abscessus subsp. abscessus]
MMSTILITRTASSGNLRRKMSAAAKVSSVGTSPAQASTTSGSFGALLAQSQIPSPLAQCARAASMLK